LILLGIGLGVISGSALKLLAPQVRQQQLALPEWLATQPWIESITPKDATQSNTESDSAGSTAPSPFSATQGSPNTPLHRVKKSRRSPNAGSSRPQPNLICR
jgi:beta-lactamase class A